MKLRHLGQKLLSRAEELRGLERTAVKAQFKVILLLFMASMGVFLILGVWAALSISRQLVQPLAKMQQAMLKISLGDFTPIPESQCRTEEFRPLFSAFNRMIRELEERQEQLFQARKIAAIGTLTSGIAHELNNPINNIVLTSETLKEELPNLHLREIDEMLQDILTQSERASEIVKNLLDFSRAERPESTSLSINTVIQDTLKLVRNHISISNIHLGIELHPELPPVRGEAQSLQQVFLNLFINAIQAMPSGGDPDDSEPPL
jgi:signal transduction histidine kinase